LYNKSAIHQFNVPSHNHITAVYGRFCFCTLFKACEPKGDLSVLDYYTRKIEVHTQTGSEVPEGIALINVITT
jgi:hypothetical protein